MKTAQAAAIFVGFCRAVTAQSVSGSAEGFATGVTGGGSATPVYPDTIDELVDYLGSDEPQVIVLTKTFDFVGTEGTTTATGCAPYGTGAGCQLAIDATGSWCGSNTKAQVTYDNAAMEGITVASNKTLIGEGSSGVLRGKGLRMVNGVSNIIIQNIEITDLNPQYVWGGDAFTFDSTDLIWVDHCSTSLLGRQHYVFGFEPNSRITLSNNFINGQTSWSAGCDGYHYWTMELVGTDDQITFKNNYITSTSGRGPALSGSTLFHAVNSVWTNISGHAIEGDTNGQGLFEGCVFDDVDTVVTSDFKGHLFSSPSGSVSQCESALGRSCETNIYTDSGAFDETDTSFFSNFTGLTIASAESASSIQSNVISNAGVGKLSSSSSSSSAPAQSSTAKASSTAKSSTVAKTSSTTVKTTGTAKSSSAAAAKSSSTVASSVAQNTAANGGSKGATTSSSGSKCKKRRRSLA